MNNRNHSNSWNDNVINSVAPAIIMQSLKSSMTPMNKNTNFQIQSHIQALEEL